MICFFVLLCFSLVHHLTIQLKHLLVINFIKNTSFLLEQFMEVKNNLAFIPDLIRCWKSRCRSTKSLALFYFSGNGIRWAVYVLWKGLVYYSVLPYFWLPAQHFWRCVQVIYYRRILPLLSNWSDEIVWHSCCDQDVLFFTDGKLWKKAQPVCGQATEVLHRAVGWVI
jgi:hypothetical protein